MDNVNHPAHYTSRMHECIDEMIAVFGKEAVVAFCKCNAWKYRYRAGSKGSYDEDMAKSDWYVNKIMEIQNGDNQKKREIQKTKNKSVASVISEVYEEICNNYCKYSDSEYISKHPVEDDCGHFEDCPLNRLN